MRRWVLGAVLGCAACCLVSCASPGRPITQTIRVETPGCPHATCRLSNDQGSWLVASTPGDILVTTSREPLKVVCQSTDGQASSAGASPILSDKHGGGALAGGIAGGAAVGIGLGSVALAFIPVLGWGLVAAGVAVGAAGGSALESSQQTLAYPPLISIALSCGAEVSAADVPRTGRFGVGIRGLDAAEVQALGFSEGGAVLVTDVAAGGVAARAGLRIGDIVRAANGRVLADVAQLERAVLALAPGSTLALRVWRSGQAVDLVLSFPESGP